jgi:hypothetical protein
MKTRKFSKKLTLNKRTIAKLNSDGMEAIIGGTATMDPTCGGSRANPEVCISMKRPTRCEDCPATYQCPSINPTVCC